MTMAEPSGNGISKAASKVASKILNKHGNPYETWEEIQEGKEGDYDESVIAQRVHVPLKLVEEAIKFWKGIYLEATIGEGSEARHLNGVEAYKLGTEEGAAELGMRMDKAPYIGMCNLMALEALRRMGDAMPTTREAGHLAFAEEREAEICDFWHKSFAPTAFQAEWAWKAALAVMAGEPHSTEELLGNYKVQLP
jgi:transposase